MRVLPRPLTRQLTRALDTRWGSGHTKGSRWMYEFDGVDDYGVLAQRAIDPDGDIEVSFSTGEVVPTDFTLYKILISQTLTSSFGSQEFIVRLANPTGHIQMVLGGSSLRSSLKTIAPNTHYRITLVGNIVTYYVNNIVVAGGTVTRGAVREPSASTMINRGGSIYTPGQLYNVIINGNLWELRNVGEVIQPSVPAGNNMTLLNTTEERWREVDV